jgi:hypothetical protein
MAEINPVGSSGTLLGVIGTNEKTSPRGTAGGGGMPPVDDSGSGVQVVLTLPTLPLPKIGGLSLEALVQAVGMDERAAATESGLESIKVRAQEREEINAKKMEEILKNLESMRSKGVLNGFLKAFKIIGMILGAVASIATIALGAVTGNPLLVAAGVVMAAMTVNSILSEATDGKVSIAAGVGAIAEACGASEQTAQWIGMAVEIGISLIGCAMSLGAGFSSAGAKAVETAAKAGEMAQKVTQIVAMTNKVVAVANGVNTVGQGLAQGVGAYYDYRTTNSQAEQKELAAILERIQEAIAMEQDFMQAVMERSNELMGDVGEIVQQNAEAQTAVLTGSAPSMA